MSNLLISRKLHLIAHWSTAAHLAGMTRVASQARRLNDGVTLLWSDRIDNVGILRLDEGVVVDQSDDFFTELGAPTYANLLAELDCFADDRTIEGILLSLSCRGGAASGLLETMRSIVAIGCLKPVFAFAPDVLQGAGLLIAGSTQRVYAGRFCQADLNSLTSWQFIETEAGEIESEQVGDEPIKPLLEELANARRIALDVNHGSIPWDVRTARAAGFVDEIVNVVGLAAEAQVLEQLKKAIAGRKAST